MPAIPIRYVGGAEGPWRVVRVAPYRGATLPTAPRLAVREGAGEAVGAAWALRGVLSNIRYTREEERRALVSAQAPTGRALATRAALLPIRKSEAWWALAQDTRRDILEEQSRHVAIGMEYLPAIARRLAHGRDLGEPFDFLTWFEYAPEDEAAFEDLLLRLRASAEWAYVEREVDIRLERDA